MAMLELNNVETFYGTIQALFGISLHCEEGQVTTLIGRNGMGKTTTVSSIIGTLASSVVKFVSTVIPSTASRLMKSRNSVLAWFQKADKFSLT